MTLVKRNISSEEVLKKLNSIINKEIEITEKLFENDKYMLYISKLLKDGGCVSDNIDEYSLNDADKEQLQFLSYFYQGIAAYANRNHVYPINDDTSSYYTIKYKNNSYDFGKTLNSINPIYYCKNNLEIVESAIYFEDIKNNKPQINTTIIESKLKLLSNLIDNLIAENVPVESIKEVVEISIQKKLIKK